MMVDVKPFQEKNGWGQVRPLFFNKIIGCDIMDKNLGNLHTTILWDVKKGIVLSDSTSIANDSSSKSWTSTSYS